jgi:hypothetical protein
MKVEVGILAFWALSPDATPGGPHRVERIVPGDKKRAGRLRAVEGLQGLSIVVDLGNFGMQVTPHLAQRFFDSGPITIQARTG